MKNMSWNEMELKEIDDMLGKKNNDKFNDEKLNEILGGNISAKKIVDKILFRY